MADRRAALVLAAGVLVLIAAGATAVVRMVARRAEPGWQPPPASGPVPPPPLGGAAPPAGSAGAPRVLRVDSSGCAPVEEHAVTARMTLDSVSRAEGVPVEILIRGLGLPGDVSRTAPLDALMREHPFTLQDVRRVAEDYLKHCESRTRLGRPRGSALRGGRPPTRCAPGPDRAPLTVRTPPGYTLDIHSGMDPLPLSKEVPSMRTLPVAALAAAALLVPAARAAAQMTPAAQGPQPLEVGAVAPDFALPGSTRFGLLKEPVRLGDFRGKTVVLAFYFRSRTRG